MSTSRNIYQRMHDIMQDVKYIQKEDKKVNNQYTFVSHDAVTAKCRVALLKHGVFVKPYITKHCAEWYDTKTEKWVDGKKQLVDGQSLRTSVEMDMEFINIDNPEEKILISSIGYGLDSQDKGAGKAYSYAYKYALLKGLMLETGDDPEKDIIETVAPKASKASKAVPADEGRKNAEEWVDGYLKKIKACKTAPDLTHLQLENVKWLSSLFSKHPDLDAEVQNRTTIKQASFIQSPSNL